MKKLKTRIGFDFDKVFVNYPQFVPDSLINRLYKKKSSDLAYRFPGNLEQQIRILSHYHMFRTPIYKNILVLQEIFNSGTETYLISSRFAFLKKRTQSWLKKYQFNTLFKEIYFNYNDKQPHEFKNNVIKKLKITHYIDDDIDLLEYLAKHNPSILFFWLSKKNTTKKTLANIYRISSLEDLPKNIYNGSTS